MIGRLRSFFFGKHIYNPDGEYAPFRKKLALAGLDEQVLRRMDPDDRVAVLEQARLDPYDYIYLAC